MVYVLYAFLTGAASAFAFEPAGLWPLLLVAFALLCEFIDRSKSLWRSLLIGWAFGLGQFVVSLNWIATAFTFQSNMPAWLGWVAVVLVSLYLAVYPAIAAGLAWRFKAERTLALVLVLAGAWPITEWLRGTMFTGFPWNPVAAANVDTLSKVVPWIGTYGAGAFVVFLSGALWMLRRWEIRPLIAWLGVGVALSLLTDWTVKETGANPRQVRVIQPNIGQQDKWRPGFDEQAAS